MMNAILVGMVGITYYMAIGRVDQFSTDHRKHLVDMHERVDRKRLQQALTALERDSAQTAAAPVEERSP